MNEYHIIFTKDWEGNAGPIVSYAALPRGDLSRGIKGFLPRKYVTKLKICRKTPKNMSLRN